MSPAPSERFLTSWIRLSWLATAVVLMLVNVAPAAQDIPPSDNKYFLRSWRVSDGLPHNSTHRIVQDARGYLWIATAGGLARFDSTRFKQYPLPDLPLDANVSIRDLAVEDERTLVLLSASAGVLRLRDGEFSEHPVNRHLADRPLYYLHAEPGGVLWVTTRDELVRWTADGVTTFSGTDWINRRGHRVSFATDEMGRTWVASAEFLGYFENGRLHRHAVNYGVIKIASARTGGFWIAGTDELLRMQEGVVRTVPTGGTWGDATVSLQHIFEDRSGTLWTAARRRGLWRLEHGVMVSTPVSHDQTVAIAEDDEGNVWVASDGGGINRLRLKIFVLLDTAAGMPDILSTGVCEDADGVLWCANRSGGVLRWKDGILTLTDGDIYANAVAPSPEGGVWVGAQQGLFKFRGAPSYTKTQMAPELTSVRVLLASRNGDLWVASSPGRLGYLRDGVYHNLTSASGFTGWQTTALVEDREGQIYVASDDRQLYVWTGKELALDVSNVEMPGGLIYTAHVDFQNHMWLGTSRGLILRRGGRLDLFTTAHGLPDDLVMQVLSADSGRLWCGSRSGIFSIDQSELIAVADGRMDRVNAVSIGPDHGLVEASAIHGLQPMAWLSRDQRLWFATHSGLVGIAPAFTLSHATPPRVYLDEVTVDGLPRAVEGSLQLGPGEHQVEFHFSALNYSSPENVKVRHRLEGYDPDWIETDGQLRAYYTRLPAGSYTLKVEASNQNGRWSEDGVALPLMVAPVWWSTWWAASLGVILSASLVAGVARRWSHRRLKAQLERLEYEHGLERERARIARDLHDDLGGSLTKISMLADRLKRQASDPEMKSKLGTLAWQTRQLTSELESIVWTVSPRNNTWDRLAFYIGQFSSTFFRDTPISAQINGDSAIPSLPLTPDDQYHVLAIVREGLHNVLKHSGASQVNVAMSSKDGIFTLRIRDNGTGFDPAAPEHAERNGLANLQVRATELGARLQIHSTPGNGSEIILSLQMTPTPVSGDAFSSVIES